MMPKMVVQDVVEKYVNFFPFNINFNHYNYVNNTQGFWGWKEVS